jgi:hypothetical protein
MTSALAPKQLVSSEELLMLQLVSSETIIRLLVGEGNIH